MMLVLTILQGLGPYAWFLVGVLFLLAEVILPGASLIWFGAAASLTGVSLFVFDMGWQAQMAAFMGYAAFTVFVGRLLAARRVGDGADRVNLGPEHLVGRELSLVEPIVHGFGRALYGDSHWRVTGPDLPAETRVRVVGIEAATLKVEPVAVTGASRSASAATPVANQAEA